MVRLLYDEISIAKISHILLLLFVGPIISSVCQSVTEVLTLYINHGVNFLGNFNERGVKRVLLF